MNDAERMRILEMLEQGTITSAEAAELLSALDERPAEGRRRERERPAAEEAGAEPPRRFRVRVSERSSGRVRANVIVPLRMVGLGLGMAHRFKGSGPPQLDDIIDAVRAGKRGTVFDVAGGDGNERVEIIIE